VTISTKETTLIMKKNIFMAAMAVAFMMSCGASKDATSAKSLNGEWEITEVNGTQINAADCENMPFLGFNESKNELYGNSGCNMLTGSYGGDTKKGQIDFSQTGMTRMLCADMKVERMVMDALSKSTHFSVDPQSNTLTLTDNSGKTVMKLKGRK
jgi:heat shock protein HslJ